jgi:hypothetical protein
MGGELGKKRKFILTQQQDPGDDGSMVTLAV